MTSLPMLFLRFRPLIPSRQRRPHRWVVVGVAGALAQAAHGCGEQSAIIAYRAAATGGHSPIGGSGPTPGDPGDTEDADPDTDAGEPGGAGGAPALVQRPRFETPAKLAVLNDPVAKDQDPSLPADLLEIFFFSDRGGIADIWTSSRSTVDGEWAPPRRIDELSSDDERDYNPTISRDGLRMWFCSSRDPAGIWYSDRPSRVEPFSAPVPVAVDPLGSDNLVIAPSLSPDFLYMAVSIGASETRDIYETTRMSLTAPWAKPSILPGINSDRADSTPFLFDSGHQILFASGRDGMGDLYWAYRPDLDGEVKRIEPLAELNDPEAFESYPHLAFDQSVVFFGSSRSGGTDIYEAKRKAEND